MLPIGLFTNILGNKYTWIALAFVAVVTYYQTSLWGLQDDLGEMTSDRNRIARDYNTTKNNLNTCVKVNNDNAVIVANFEAKIAKLKEQNGIITQGQSEEIKKLKKIIADMKKPVNYTDTLEFKDVKIKIKTKEQIDENDTTFSIISNIGS